MRRRFEELTGDGEIKDDDAFSRVKEEMEIVKTMNTLQQARDFVSSNGFDLMKNLTQLYMLAEREWRMRNTKIINSTNHVCDPDVCTVKHLKVTVYRKESATAIRNVFDFVANNNNNNNNKKKTAVDYDDEAGASVDTASLHICIPEICEHLQPDHTCPRPRLCTANRCVHVQRFCYAPSAKRMRLQAELAVRDGGRVQLLTSHSHFDYTDECAKQRCAHVTDGSVCQNRDYCPHGRSYLPSEIRELKDFWVCEQTGAAHICGESCLQRKIQTIKEMHVICALTRAFVRTTLIHEDAWKYETSGKNTPARLVYSSVHSDATSGIDSIRNICNGNSPLMLTEKMAMEIFRDESNHKFRNGSSSVHSTNAANAHIPPWRRPNDLMLNKTLAKLLFTELIFSERRQAMEIDMVINSRRQMFKEMQRALRHRKMAESLTPDVHMFDVLLRSHMQACNDTDIKYTIGGHSTPTKANTAASVFTTYNRRSLYFMHIPVRPNLIPHAKKQFDDIYGKNLANMTAKQIEHNFPIQRRKQEIIRKLDSQCTALLHDVVARHAHALNDEEEDDEDDKPVERQPVARMPFDLLPEWNSKEWEAKMENITDLVARLLVRIWVNLNEHCEKMCAEISFRRIVLPLMYMLQTPLTFKAQNVTGIDGPERMPQVVIIPCIDFCRLLPSESSVHRLQINDYCPPLSKTITSIQTYIQNLFWNAAQAGKLDSVRIKLAEFT